jgi:L-rhamnose mutarotase
LVFLESRFELTRYAQIIRLRAEDEEEYIRYHAAVWPTVLATIAACNIRNYSIFLRDGVLFAYFEYHGTDYAADMRKMAADSETQRWWKIMDPMQMPMENAAAGEKWSPLPEVFHVD